MSITAVLESHFGTDVEVKNAGSHWLVIIPVAKVAELSHLERQRKVKKLLTSFFDSGEIHALSVQFK